jgi:hypothetical protein
VVTKEMALECVKALRAAGWQPPPQLIAIEAGPPPHSPSWPCSPSPLPRPYPPPWPLHGVPRTLALSAPVCTCPMFLCGQVARSPS